MLILQTTRNEILADNFTRNPSKYMEHAEYHLGKWLTMMDAEVEHAEVQRMMAEEEKIAKANHLEEMTQAKKPSRQQLERAAELTPLGKRPDHDSLPDEIQAKWAENLPILREMRDLHAKLRLITATDNSTVCHDGDRYPLVKRLIELDQRSKQNYREYDEYGK